jgi:antitoxin HicB
LRTNPDTLSPVEPTLDIRFCATELGAEPVRVWLYQEDASHISTGLGFSQGSAQTTAQEVIMGKKNIDSSFDDFLAEEAILEESTAIAMKRVIAWQIAQEMKAQQMTKTDLAKRMHTSRAALNRLLDEKDGSLTLTTLASAAAALGKRVNLQLAPA